ncbi:MAG: hypothetical protein ABJF10_13605 [Chthoniobacter sp.]|uniref:hypothetical protein n=1 Tax=Chthoniobacter sp. TaxID=2510640 RepID=UPI0032A32021
MLPREQIETLNLDPFLDTYGLNALPRGAKLGALMGRFNFTVEGYSGDPRDIYANPKVRAFYRKLAMDWPYWLYFCDLRTDCLLAMTLCCLNRVSGVKKQGERTTLVMYTNMEVGRFVYGRLLHMNGMFDWAHAPEMAIYQRTKAVMDYFKLPFDQPPPG